MTQYPDPEHMTDAEIEAALSGNAPLTESRAPPDGPSFSRIRIAWPGAKAQICLRLDHETLDWFRADGPGYQTRINAVLRAFVTAQPRRRR